MGKPMFMIKPMGLKNGGNINAIIVAIAIRFYLIDSVVSPNDTFLNKYSGNVPSYENIKIGYGIKNSY